MPLTWQRQLRQRPAVAAATEAAYGRGGVWKLHLIGVGATFGGGGGGAVPGPDGEEDGQVGGLQAQGCEVSNMKKTSMKKTE